MAKSDCAPGRVVGIALLIFELQQNRDMVRAQTRAEISSELTGLLSQVAGDPLLANLVRRADDGEALPLDEQKQDGHRSAAMFRYFENVHYQYRQDLDDESEFFAHRDAWRVFFNRLKALRKIGAIFELSFRLNSGPKSIAC